MNGFYMETQVRYAIGGLMSSEISRRLFTIDDCYRMLDAGILHEDDRVELIRGDLLNMSPIGTRHQSVVDGANRELVRSAGDSAIVRVQGTIELDRFSAPQPDLVLLRPRDDLYLHKHPAAPDIFLIIEVADSSLEYDTTVKLALYAIMGVHEYWVVDLRNNRLLCYSQPAGDSYRSVREFHRCDTVAPNLLPNCRISADILLPT
jgi:Uma2 family endonuclease